MRNLIPWEPFRDLVDFGRIVDRFFDRGLSRRKTSSGLWTDGFWAPAIDLYDKKDRFIVKAELPGIEKKDINVNIDGDTLTIKGQTQKDNEVKEKDYYYNERVFGSFYRSISLPENVQKENVKASYKDGILTIELPKSKKVQPKGIDIKVE